VSRQLPLALLSLAEETQMIKSGNYVIIPIGVSCFVIEETENGLKHVGDDPGKPLEETLNHIRTVMHGMAKRERRNKDINTRNWKRFQATKEFMGKEELAMTETMWADFDLEKENENCERFAAAFEKSFFEVTDLMLEHNVTIRAMDEDSEEPKGVSLESVKSMLGNLGKLQ
jgi:hypothetical protein